MSEQDKLPEGNQQELNQQPEPKQPGTGVEEWVKDPEQAWQGVQNLRADKARLQARLSEIEAQAAAAAAEKQKAEEARLAEQGEYKQLAEKYQAQLATLQDEIAAAKRQNMVIAEASKLGFVDPGDAVALVGQVAEGKVAEAVAELAKAKPHLLRRPGAPNFTTPNPADNAGINMDVINAHRNDVQWFRDNMDAINAYLEKQRKR